MGDAVNRTMSTGITQSNEKPDLCDDDNEEKRNLIDYHATLLNLAKREYVLLVAIQDMYL